MIRLKFVTLLLCGPLLFGSLAPVQAAGEISTVGIDVSEGRLITLSAPAANVFIADPTVADIQVPMPNRVFIFGKKVGHTTLYALGTDGTQLARISVDVSSGGAAVGRAIADDARAGGISVKNSNDGVILDGSAPDAATAAYANRQASRFVHDKDSKIDDRVSVKSSVQVSLHVRIAEVSRTIKKELGFNWSTAFSAGAGAVGFATGRNALSAAGQVVRNTDNSETLFGTLRSKRANVNAVIDALANEGLVTILAEPNLTALSGETASFLAGGEFPVPIAQSGGAGTGNGNTITILFKQFGISLDFVPTVLASNRINMRVRPEVSQLSDQGAITIQGFQIPGLLVRRAETTVELGSGESFAIGGLLQNNMKSEVDRLPGLGDVPILGALFRSTQFQRNESELVIIVTPYIVKPVADPKALRLPTDGIRAPTDLEEMLYGKTISPDPAAVNPSRGNHLLGDAGFEIE
jgi:pilus assembly protein CpaC